VQAAFGTVLVVVVIVAGLVAIALALTSSRLYDRIGRGGLSLRDGTDRPATEPPPAMAAAQRDEEVRQLLEARNARRVRQGKPPLDVEAEAARLLAPVADAGLEAEVRQLVVARNARRVRQGKPPLDVEAEVRRQLADLGGV
jgi:hypothetical protein